MGGKPASLLFDATSHGSVIVSGSPDTIIESRPAVRLNDITTPCPLPHPPNKVTKTSRSVFINRLGVARRGDQTTCGGAGAPSGGCSHPPAEGYKVRSEDAYHKVITVEHEASDWDDVVGYDREALSGDREKPSIPLGPPAKKRSAARMPGETIKTPVGSEKMYEIRSLPRGSRPDPKTYLDPEQEKQHLDHFAGGASYLVPKDSLDRRGRELIGRPDGQFISPGYEVDNLLATTGGDISLIEKELGIPEGSWAGKELVRIDIPDTKASNIRVPSGNEAGANVEWIPGGELPTGQREAVVDQLAAGSYTETSMSDAVAQAKTKQAAANPHHGPAAREKGNPRFDKTSKKYVPALQEGVSSTGGGGKSGEAVKDEDEDARKKKKKLPLDFSLDVKLDKRKGTGGFAGMNSIAGPCAMTVIVGD